MYLAGSACANSFAAKNIASVKKQIFFILSGIILIPKINKNWAIRGTKTGYTIGIDNFY